MTVSSFQIRVILLQIFPKKLFEFCDSFSNVRFGVVKSMMGRTLNFKPFFWLGCFFITCLAHENGCGLSTNDEQDRAWRNPFDLLVVVEIHETSEIGKHEHAA